VQDTLREVCLNIMSNSECAQYAMPKYEQKYCSGKPMINQDTCQVSSY